MKSQSFNICWHVEYFDIERERSVEISTLDESSFIPSGRYQSIAAIKRNKSPLLKSKRYTRRGEPNKYWKSRCELVIMTAVTGQLTSRSRSNSAELTTMSACDGGELVTGWKEDHADRHAIPSLYPTDFCKSSSYFVLFFCFSFRWTTVPSKRIIYAHRNRASIYSRSPDHRMNFAIPATFEGVLPSHSACMLSPCQVTR
jgi:hypothetical protein